MSDSRSQNTKRNIVSGLIYSGVSILFPFLIRTVIIYALGMEYVGLQSLFSSILQVLNLAELGFSSAVVYHMYRPIAEGDTDTVCALLAYYKKIYRNIGIIILAAGVAIMPWLPKLIEGSWPSDINIYVLYLLYLFNTGISYMLFAYKSSLLSAVQRKDLVDQVSIFISTAKYLVQILVLILSKNFYLFVVVSVVATVATNIATAYIANKRYPEYQCRGRITEQQRKDVRKQVNGLMIGKVSDVSRNAFDSIVLSALFGLTTVAIYGNYYYIYSAVYSVMLVITRAMQASIGNSMVLESKEKNYRDIQKFQFIFSWIAAWCTVCLCCLYQPFMALWAGKDMLLPWGQMALFCVYFYAINMNNIRNQYFSASGIWWEARLTFVLEAVGNLVLNIVLGITMGITGILLATIITIFVFNFVSRTNLLFKLYFSRSPKGFYLRHLQYALVTLAVTAITYFLCSRIPLEGIPAIIIRGVVCIIVPNCLMLAVYWKHPKFLEAKDFALSLVKRKRRHEH